MLAEGSLQRGDQVRSERFGIGRIEFDSGPTVIIRFEHGIEECEKVSLTPIRTPTQAASSEQWDAPLEVITRAQAEAIQSVNDTWGVFSRSRIALLPHQLWVCRRVNERWPARWLVADDVGLGKTIEAGLILWPLLANGTVRRLLILCRASLVEQWQYRLRTMFDIRMARYTSDTDTPKADFWNTHNQVVASLETIRADSRGRHERLFESEPWDLIIVDEAHHLNADEQAGPTLGYRLVERLVEEKLVTSMVFFTGTPHRGKNYGFVSLLHLLRPDLFDARSALAEQLSRLREVMIRNNKQNVTDLAGKRLFQEPLVSSETYHYSESESRFYALLTEFITEGKAYASSLSSADGRTAMLVLIAMQKLASSSVAAVHRALKARLERIVIAGKRLSKITTLLEARDWQDRSREYEALEELDDGDRISRLEEEFLALTAELRLLQDEEPRLRELVMAAEQVKEETKIRRIIETIDTRFAGRSVLLFTEYKATQSLLMSALIRRFGDGCVGFINGDDRAEGVVDGPGRPHTFHERRDVATEKFNAGGYRFLVSTEAGGEGIDLQERCHCLIHVDLPWNPMRLHQRVGRLNRYGQTSRVEVVSLHNPDTVESLIWEKLNHKIEQIMLALGQAMDEPEDLMQLILGMASPSLMREVFSEAVSVPRSSLSSWFDSKTARFGGKDAIQTVKEIVGHCSSFDYQRVSAQLPPLDLPDLAPFIRGMLSLNGRRVREEADGISFKTPDAWGAESGLRSSYERLIFDRQDRSRDAAQRVLGVGHKLMDCALRQAKLTTACVASIPDTVLERPLLVLRVTDRVTNDRGLIRATILGVVVGIDGQTTVLQDWQTLQRLNEVLSGRGVRRSASTHRPEEPETVQQAIEGAKHETERQLGLLGLPYRVPMVEPVAILWPVPARQEDEYHSSADAASSE